MKKPEIMDDKFKMKLSSMKTAENVDGKMQARSVCIADYIKSLLLCVN